MFPSIDTKNPKVVEQEVARIHQALFPHNQSDIVRRAFAQVNDCFAGRFKSYRAIDLKYHNYEHTLQVLLCMMNLLHGRHNAGAAPVLTPEFFDLSLLAILLHDTGYLKTSDDVAGTGAKYTMVHVGRSCDFAAVLLPGMGCSPAQITSVQNMIRCTGVNVDLSRIAFQSPLEQTLGYALGTADLVGQMSADDYVTKLPFLYLEFKESFEYTSQFSKVAELYTSADHLMQNTWKFWEFYVKPKINNDFGKLYEYLRNPYPDGPNEYIQRIERHIDGLKAKYGV